MQIKYFFESERSGRLSFCILSTLLLFLGFFSNCWHVAEPIWFKTYERYSESLVVGRMVKSRQDGIFSVGGLTGAGIETNVQEQGISPKQIQDQYWAYLKGLTFDEYSPYLSQIGGQCMLFSLLDKLIPLSPQTKLQSFYASTSFLSAIALTWIILWFYGEFGGCVAGCVLGSTILSQWLTVFGRNLWWSLWAFYLPMIVVMRFVKHYRGTENRLSITLGIPIFISVFTKCFINGYEYMTTTLVMMTVPVVYYAIRYRWSARQFLKWTLVAVFSSCAAILLSLTLLCFQIGSVKGDFLDGVAHIVFSLGKRTHGNPQSFPSVYAASLEADTIGVVITYVGGIFLDLNNYLPSLNSFISHFVFKIRYAYLIVLFAVASVILFSRSHEKTTARQRQKHLALIFSTWFSILAPLSWYVVFRAHSYTHTHMNYILWQMPFTLFGFAICGLIAKRILSRLTQDML